MVPGAVSILLALSEAASAQFTPAPGSPFAVASQPHSVAAGDFNGDGHQDLVIANQANNDVTVLLGDGIGGFTAAPGGPFPTGAYPNWVAVGDFNGDGKPDLAIANLNGNNVTVLLGNGTGGFTAAPGSPFLVGTDPWSVAVGDYNRDGKADLAIANNGSNSLTVLLGDGTGGFTPSPGSPFPVGTSPTSVAVADFNGDGKPDIAISNQANNNVTLLLGNGTGGFAAAPGSPFAVGSTPYSMVQGDFNGDGKPDLAVANEFNNNVTVLLGDGTGGSAEAPDSPFAVGSTPSFVAAGDFNGDGKLDLVTTSTDNNNVTVLLGNGTGGFAAASGSPVPVGTFPLSVAVADFNADGEPDLAIANYFGNSVTVLLNSTPHADLVWENDRSRQVTVNYFGGAQGAILAGWNWLNIGGILGWHVVAVADFDGNGTADLVWQNDTTSQITVNFYGGSGGATFQNWCYLNAGSNVGWDVVGAADFDGNGVPDLIWQNKATRQVTVNYYGGTNGCTLLNWNWLNASGFPGWTVVGAADYDGNGVPDLIWQNDATRQVTVNYYGGTGRATLTGWNWLNASGEPGWTVAGTADFDGNGVPDLVWQNENTTQVTVNYYGGTGGATLIAWSWLNASGAPGWHAFVPGRP